MKKCMEIAKEKYVALMIFFLGLIFSVLIPTWQIPDEYAHISMIGSGICIEDFAEKFEDEVALDRDRIAFQHDEKIDFEKQMEVLTKRVSWNRKEMLPHGISISVIKHLPATLGIELGILLGIPAYWVLLLGEIAALIFYTMCCYWALKIMPVKKEVMAYIMLFPIAIQEAASLSYDAVLIPLCFLFVADIFYLKYKKDSVGLKDALIAAVIWLVIVYIKVPYLFIAFFVLLLPIRKVKIRIGSFEINEKMIRKVRVPFCITVVAIASIGIYFLRNNLWIQIIYGYIMEWKQAIGLLYTTGAMFRKDIMISTVGNFGWLDTPMNLNVVYFVFGVLLFFAITRNKSEKEYKLGKWDVIVMVLTFGVLCGFTTMSMTHHTIMTILFGGEANSGAYKIREAMYQIPFIGGLQGRYFLPFLPALFLALPQKIEIRRNVRLVIFCVFEGLIYIYSIVLLIQRFWIG